MFSLWKDFLTAKIEGFDKKSEKDLQYELKARAQALIALRAFVSIHNSLLQSQSILKPILVFLRNVYTLVESLTSKEKDKEKDKDTTRSIMSNL